MGDEPDGVVRSTKFIDGRSDHCEAKMVTQHRHHGHEWTSGGIYDRIFEGLARVSEINQRLVIGNCAGGHSGASRRRSVSVLNFTGRLHATEKSCREIGHVSRGKITCRFTNSILNVASKRNDRVAGQHRRRIKKN